MARITIQPGDRLLDKYYKTLRDLRERQHARTEGETRRAFSALLSGLGRRRKLDLVEEAPKKATNSRKKIRLDGVLRDEWMRDYAYWEAKDSGDQLDSEIIKKKSDGYPLTNIIFEDTVNAVLYQDGYEVRRTLIREKKNFARPAQPISQLPRRGLRKLQRSCTELWRPDPRDRHPAQRQD